MAVNFPNNPPTDLNSTSQLTFSENQPIGTIVGELNASDPEGGAITYHFVSGDNNNSLFTLDQNGILRTATVFNYETNASNHAITVQAKDEYNASVEGNFTVMLQNILEMPIIEGFSDTRAPGKSIIEFQRFVGFIRSELDSSVSSVFYQIDF